MHHETQISTGELKRSLVVIAGPPVAVLDGVQSIIGSWWSRAGGYPVGRRFGTVIDIAVPS